MQTNTANRRAVRAADWSRETSTPWDGQDEGPSCDCCGAEMVADGVDSDGESQWATWSCPNVRECLCCERSVHVDDDGICVRCSEVAS